MNVNHCFIYTIGIINFLGMQVIQPYWMYLSYQLHNWHYHFSGIKLSHMFGIITYLRMQGVYKMHACMRHEVCMHA